MIKLIIMDRGTLPSPQELKIRLLIPIDGG